MPPRALRFASVAAVILALDQGSKALARHFLEPGVPVPVIQGWFDWRLGYNPGIAFSLFTRVGGGRVVLSLVALVACVVIALSVRRVRDDARWTVSALGLVFGGAAGNLADRALAGRVTDFIHWHAGAHDWPTFNVADAALVVGVLLMVFDVGGDQRRAKAARTTLPSA